MKREYGLIGHRFLTLFTKLFSQKFKQETFKMLNIIYLTSKTLNYYLYYSQLSVFTGIKCNLSL